MGKICSRERQIGGPAGTEKLLDPGASDYDAQMAKKWGGPMPKHFPKHWEDLPKKHPDCEGKIALITGGTGGIGFYVAKMLAHLGYELILPVRTGFDDEGKSAAVGLLRDVPGAKIETPEETLDLESFESVRKFAAAMIKRRKQIDLLCLNAGRGGAAGDPREETKDGMETIMQVNAVSHLLLAAELLPLLQASPAARIVSQSSTARLGEAAGGLPKTKAKKLADLNSVDPKVQQPYHAFHSYNISKAGTCWTTIGLNRRLKAKGVNNVIALVCEPGFVATGVNIQHDIASGFLGCPVGAINTSTLHSMLAHHAADGALPMVMACVDKEPDTMAMYQVEGGTAGPPKKVDPTVGDPKANALHDPMNIEKGSWPKDSTDIFWNQVLKFTGPLPTLEA